LDYDDNDDRIVGEGNHIKDLVVSIFICNPHQFKHVDVIQVDAKLNTTYDSSKSTEPWPRSVARDPFAATNHCSVLIHLIH